MATLAMTHYQASQRAYYYNYTPCKRLKSYSYIVHCLIPYGNAGPENARYRTRSKLSREKKLKPLTGSAEERRSPTVIVGKLDMVAVNAPPSTATRDNVTEHTSHPRPSSAELETDPQTLLVITSALLAGLTALALFCILITLINRRRKSRKYSTKIQKVSLPPIPEDDKENDIMNGVSQATMDVLYDQNTFKHSKKKNTGTNGTECHPCFDRGNSECQGHGGQSPTDSLGSKERKDLNFLEPSGFYDHIKVQTDPVYAAACPAHEYSELMNCTSGRKDLPQPRPRLSNGGTTSQTTNYYANLQEVFSAADKADAGSEYEYIVPAHYEELPNHENGIPKQPSEYPSRLN